MTVQSVFIIAAFLAVFWRIYTMSAALDRLNTAVDGLIARAADQSSPAAPADQTPPTFG